MAKFFSDRSLDSFLYIGDDCLFYKIPDYPTDKKVYVADTASYISSKYIKRSGDALFYGMCNVVGIDPEIVEFNDSNCGGAQHLFNVCPPVSYWKKVESDSEKLLAYCNDWNVKNPTKRIQAWTAGMWALLWNLWALKIETETSKEMDFSWPSTRIEKINDFNFFHNAGVTEKRADVLFFKGAYRDKEPENLNFVDKNYCSSWYADQVVRGLAEFKTR